MSIRILTSVLSSCATICAILLVSGFLVFINVASELPSYEQLEAYDPPTITRFYDNAGDVIAEYGTERRVLVSYSEIPDFVIKAFLAAEDRHFFEHQGVDFYGLARAILQNAINIMAAHNRRAVGGSTITQQVVKSFLLGNERTFSRKVKEAVLAYRISKVYSKDRILELYLNQIFFGNNSYGIYAAAQNYFNKELSELTISEAALLASLPKAPSSLNPFKNYDKAKDRRDWVLKRMYEENFITHDELVRYSQQPIDLAKKEAILKYDETFFYSEAVKQQLIAMYGEEVVYERGLVTSVNMDKAMQHTADQVFHDGILKYDRRHGWRGPVAKIRISKKEQSHSWAFGKDISVDDDKYWKDELAKIDEQPNRDGYVLAVVLETRKTEAKIGLRDGHIGYIALEQLKWARQCLPNQRLGAVVKHVSQVLQEGDVVFVSESKQVNGIAYYNLEQVPDVNGGLVVLQPKTGKVLAMVGGYNFKDFFNRVMHAQRQPGSAFKTFVYLTAFENGFTLDSKVLNTPIKVFQGEHLPLWSPRNFEDGFQGEVNLETALAKSLNIPTVKLMLSVGVEKVIKRSAQLGVYDKAPPSTGYSIALGAFETTLMNITNAYNTIASGGYRSQPLLIGSVYDRKGHLIYSDDGAICQGCDTWSSYDPADHEDHVLLPTLGYFRERLIAKRPNRMIATGLRKVIENGTGRGAKPVGKTMGGKTGTTNNDTDAWFIGFSRDLTVGIYVGFDSPRTLGRNEIGATLALPIYTAFMKQALRNVKDGPIASADDGVTEMIPINDDGSHHRRVISAEMSDNEGRHLRDSIGSESGINGGINHGDDEENVSKSDAGVNVRDVSDYELHQLVGNYDADDGGSDEYWNARDYGGGTDTKAYNGEQ